MNRLVAEALSIFLDVCRRPDTADPDEWAAAVRSRVLVGMGVMDLQPNEDDTESAIALAFFATAIAASMALTAAVL